MIEKKERYLGDGLYVSWDGEQVRLRAPRMDGDSLVYMDSWVAKSFEDFMKDVAAGKVEKSEPDRWKIVVVEPAPFDTEAQHHERGEE